MSRRRCGRRSLIERRSSPTSVSEDTGPAQDTDAPLLELFIKELEDDVRCLYVKKAPGPDGLTNEHHRLRTRARDSPCTSGYHQLLSASGRGPCERRRATIVPIPKVRKNRAHGKLHPITLTSHVSKLAEKLILARLSHIVNLHQIRRARSA